MKVEFLPEAFDELQQAVSYLNHENSSAGDRFESAFWKAIDSICDAPDAWQRASRRHGAKSFAGLDMALFIASRADNF